MDFRLFTPQRIVFWIANDTLISGTLKQYAQEYFPKYKDFINGLYSSSWERDRESFFHNLYCTNHGFPMPEINISELLQAQYDMDEETADRLELLFLKNSI